MILHILKCSEWNGAVKRGAYAPPSLSDEGFIHCSTIAQAVDTANIYFRGEPDLIVLCIEEVRVASPLKYEAPASTGRARSGGLFPHIYGPLNLDAVTRVLDFPRDEGGAFRLPVALRDLAPKE
ncbi:MAG TPA: DUF952 domain-containing protein [Candidatus Binataceae bacterium]|nr:DUF952 domain-containing protein [Candidatus Binataceae bacterium]